MNNTKIKYIQVSQNIYKILEISLSDMTIKAIETDVSIADIPESEMFNITDLREFRITLVNNGGQADIIEFNVWKKEHNNK